MTKEENREYQKQWRLKNREKVILAKKKHYEENKESYKIRAAKFNKSEKRKQWKEQNKEQISLYNKQKWPERKKLKPHLKRFYGITLQNYNDMFDFQNGICLGCSTHQSQLNKALSVDHCHITGRVRGLLCDECNKALGLVKDNISILNRLVKYLQGEQSTITNKIQAEIK